MLKNSFLVLVITMLSAHGPETALIAGQVAVITFLLRGIEALCQPLVMLVMTDSLSKDSTDRIRRMVETAWIALASVTIPLMVALFLFCQPIVRLYLGSRFQGLGEEFGIISLSLLPTVAVVLFRGHLDGKLKISPIMYANIGGLIAVGAATWFLLDSNTVTLKAIAWTIVAIRWVQFAFVMWLLRYLFGVSSTATRLRWMRGTRFDHSSVSSGHEVDVRCCSTQSSSFKSHCFHPHWRFCHVRSWGSTPVFTVCLRPDCHSVLYHFRRSSGRAAVAGNPGKVGECDRDAGCWRWLPTSHVGVHLPNVLSAWWLSHDEYHHPEDCRAKAGTDQHDVSRLGNCNLRNLLHTDSFLAGTGLPSVRSANHRKLRRPARPVVRICVEPEKRPVHLSAVDQRKR